MKEQDLMDNLSKLGLTFLMPSEEVDVNETLAEVVKSDDMRLWEGFPVLLANAVKHSAFSMTEVESELSMKQREFFRDLLLMSLSVYAFANQEFSWSRSYKQKLSSDDGERVKQWRNYLAHGQPLSLSGRKFSSSRLLKNFRLYASEAVKKAKRSKERHTELSLDYAQSQLFTPRQKEILNKKLDGLRMTKTEQEYYSRSIKKKVVALANEELHAIAKRLLEQR